MKLNITCNKEHLPVIGLCVSGLLALNIVLMVHDQRQERLAEAQTEQEERYQVEHVSKIINACSEPPMPQPPCLIDECPKVEGV